MVNRSTILHSGRTVIFAPHAVWSINKTLSVTFEWELVGWAPHECVGPLLVALLISFLSTDWLAHLFLVIFNFIQASTDYFFHEALGIT